MESVEHALTVPESALEFSGDSTFVYVKNATGSYDRKPIPPGISDGINIVVTSGLKEGDKVRGSKMVKN